MFLKFAVIDDRWITEQSMQIDVGRQELRLKIIKGRQYRQPFGRLIIPFGKVRFLRMARGHQDPVFETVKHLQTIVKPITHAQNSPALLIEGKRPIARKRLELLLNIFDKPRKNK